MIKIIIIIPNIIIFVINIIEVFLISLLNISIQITNIYKRLILIFKYIIYLKISQCISNFINRVVDKELKQSYVINYNYIIFKEKVLSFYLLNLIIISVLFLKFNILSNINLNLNLSFTYTYIFISLSLTLFLFFTLIVTSDCFINKIFNFYIKISYIIEQIKELFRDLLNLDNNNNKDNDKDNNQDNNNNNNNEISNKDSNNNKNDNNVNSCNVILLNSNSNSTLNNSDSINDIDMEFENKYSSLSSVIYEPHVIFKEINILCLFGLGYINPSWYLNYINSLCTKFKVLDYKSIVSYKNPEIFQSESESEFEFENINDLELKLNQSLLKFKNLISELQSLINDKGYVEYRMFLDIDSYPLINSYLRRYVDISDCISTWCKFNKKDKNNITELDIDNFINYKLNKMNDNVLSRLLKWSIEVLLVEYFVNITSLLEKAEPYFDVFQLSLKSKIKNAKVKRIYYEGLFITDENTTIRLSDLISDLTVALRILKQKIDPSIRSQFRKGSLTLERNIFVGYDTEYQNIDLGKVDLLTAQFAVNKRLILTVPIPVDYSLSKLHTLTSECFDKVLPNSINKDSIEFDINKLIKKYRLIKYKDYDLSILNLIAYLQYKDYSFDRNTNKISFYLKRSHTTQIFLEILNSKDYNFQSVVKYIQDNSEQELTDMELELTTELKNNYKKWLSYDFFDKFELNKLNLNYNINNNLHLNTDFEWSINTDIKLITTKDLKSDSDFVFSKSDYIGSIFKSTSFTSFSLNTEKIKLNKKNNIILIGHFTTADMCNFNDFKSLEPFLDIINGTFVTIQKPVRVGNVNIILRDTGLLTSPGSSLEKIGVVVDNPKIKIDKKYYNNMKSLLVDNKELFISYAMGDSLIALKFAIFMEIKNNLLCQTKIPLTITQLSGNNLIQEWTKSKYPGYDLSVNYKIGEVSEWCTPLELRSGHSVLSSLPYYIASYNGGRNESFMIGYDFDNTWYDADLNGAYSTAMCNAGHPDYNNWSELTSKELELLNDSDLINSYIVIHSEYDYTISKKDFKLTSIEINDAFTLVKKSLKNKVSKNKFKILLKCELDKIREVKKVDLLKSYSYLENSNTGNYLKDSKVFINNHLQLWGSVNLLPQHKYPVLFDRVDNNTTGYVLKGEGYFTGIEYMLAKKQGCRFKFKRIIRIPFDQSIEKPFGLYIQKLTKERSKYLKGTLNNEVYKLMMNAMYGQLTQGISNKKKFDNKTKQMIKSPIGKFSNPIIGSWVTAFIRSVLTETMTNINILGYKIVSVTTDGFITDLDNLENVILNSTDPLVQNNRTLLELYIKWRSNVTGKSNSLAFEYKNEAKCNSEGEVLYSRGSKGLFSWCTRGQYSLDHRIGASTNFQRKSVSVSETDSIFNNWKEKGINSFDHVVVSLRKARSIVDEGGSVTQNYFDMPVSLTSDNRVLFKPKILLSGETLINSKPFYNKMQCVLNRGICNYTKKGFYNKNSFEVLVRSRYKNYFEIGVRSFVRAWCRNDYGLKIPISDYKSICKFINSIARELSVDYRLSPAQIAMMKFRRVNKRLLPEHDHIKILGIGIYKYYKLKHKGVFDIDSWLVERLES